MLVIFVFLIHLIVWNQFFWGEQELVELKWVLLSIFFVYFLEFLINAKKVILPFVSHYNISGKSHMNVPFYPFSSIL